MTTPTPKPASEPKRRKPVDWDAVIRDHRVGALTDMELATKHGVTREAISRRRKKDNEVDPSTWARDLTEQVSATTSALLLQEHITTQITQDHVLSSGVILAQAELNKSVILSHRSGLNRISRIKDMLLGHIEETAQHLPEIAKVVELARSPDENGVDKLNDALKKALGRSGIVDDLKKLAEVDERVRRGEREAFSIGDTTSDDPMTTLLKRIVNNGSAFKPVAIDPAHIIDNELDD